MVILEQLFEMYTFGMAMQFERIVMVIFLPSKKSKNHNYKIVHGMVIPK